MEYEEKVRISENRHADDVQHAELHHQQSVRCVHAFVVPSTHIVAVGVQTRRNFSERVDKGSFFCQGLCCQKQRTGAKK